MHSTRFFSGIQCGENMPPDAHPSLSRSISAENRRLPASGTQNARPPPPLPKNASALHRWKIFPRALAHNRHRGKQHRLPWRAFPTGSGAVSAANTLRSGALRPRKGSRRERQPAACPLAQQRAAPWLRAGFACQRAGYTFRLPKKHARLEARFPYIISLRHRRVNASLPKPRRL